MIDRASTFADPEILKLLEKDFVPVALDQAYERREKDAWGEFYRRIASQSPRADFQNTTQGFYVATAGGELLLYNNNRDPEKLARLLREARERFAQSAAAREIAPKLESGEREARYAPKPPEGGLSVRVRSRVLGGYRAPKDELERAFQSSTGRDMLWVTREEHLALARSELAPALLERLARFHLVDNTRGEPPMWAASEIAKLEATLKDGRLEGRFELATRNGERRFRGALLGRVSADAERVVRFDVVALGGFIGEGQYTRNGPPGEFPFAVAFALADGSDPADSIPPQGSRGWIDGYLRLR